MHKEHRQQHLKSNNNNIISKLAVIILSIVLLTVIFIIPAIQVGSIRATTIHDVYNVPKEEEGNNHFMVMKSNKY